MLESFRRLFGGPSSDPLETPAADLPEPPEEEAGETDAELVAFFKPLVGTEIDTERPGSPVAERWFVLKVFPVGEKDEYVRVSLVRRVDKDHHKQWSPKAREVKKWMRQTSNKNRVHGDSVLYSDFFVKYVKMSLV